LVPCKQQEKDKAKRRRTMIPQERCQEELVEQLARRWLQQHAGQRLRDQLPLLRLLARGVPVSWEQLADALGEPVERVRARLGSWEELVFDGRGRILGAGLSLVPTPYRFVLDGQQLWTWCAFDTLLFPCWLEQPARVEAQCPESGTPIRLEVTPAGLTRLEPARAMISLRLPATVEPCPKVRAAFCDYSRFFASPEAAARWQARTPEGIILPLAVGWHLARRLAGLVLAADRPAAEEGRA
jgi:alkylmercury lyase